MLYIEPHAGPAPIVQVITDARHTVDLNVYYLSSKPILSALRRAHARGVNVRVILDRHPYGIKPWMVRKEVRAVRETGATLRWAPSRFEAGAGHYRFDHAKYVVSGHEVEIGTANFDWSAFHKNREYLHVTGNTAIVKAAQRVFDADWNDQKAGPYPHQVLVLSPGSAAQMIFVIDQPGPVDIESEEMGDDRTIISAIAAKGHAARVDDLPFPQSLPEFQRMFPDTNACANYLQRLRWPGGSVCSYCAEIGDPRRIATRPS
jgi:hypothetical protein